MMIDLAKIGELLSKGLEADYLKEGGSVSGRLWKELVEPHTKPFLEAVSENLTRLKPGFNLTIHDNEGGATKMLQALHLAEYRFPHPLDLRGENPTARSPNLTLEVAVGSCKNLPGIDASTSLVWSLTWWGRGERAEAIAQAFRHVGLERLAPICVVGSPVFGGKAACCYKAMSFHALRGRTDTGEDLALEVASDLVGLAHHLEGRKDDFLRLALEENKSTPAREPQTQETQGEDRMLQQVVELAKSFGQVILYGPPGTGKTRLARQAALALLDSRFEEGQQRDQLENSDVVARELNKLSSLVEYPRFKQVVFHPAYEYDQFVGGLIARTQGGQITYEVEEGAFLQICRTVEREEGQTAVLLIDEINRGNLPKLLGELVFGLERGYRDTEVDLPFERPARNGQTGGRKFKVPRGLFVLATMNSSDRSIGQIDVAIRRRFALIRIGDDDSAKKAITRAWARFGPDGERMADRLGNLLDGINRLLREAGSDGEDLGVGQSYFLPESGGSFDQSKTMLDLRWKHQVLPLLAEFRVMTGAALEKVSKPTLEEALTATDSAQGKAEA